jgi:hypothetical protein
VLFRSAKTTADEGYFFSLRGNRLGVNLTEDELPSYTLDINGSIRCVEVLVTSDETAKSDISDAAPEWCAERVSGLTVKTYVLNGAGKGRRVGLIAQNLHDVLPDAVSAAPGKDLAVDTAQVVALLVGAVQKLQATVNEQQLSIKALQASLASLV